MGNLLCCTGGLLCMAISSFQHVPNSALKGSYYVLLFFTVLLSLVFIFYPGYSAYWISFLGNVSCNLNCGAVLATRLWFALACLSVLQILLVLLFRDGCVFLKICLFFGLFVASLWIDAQVMEWFLWVAEFAYLAFYVGQSVVVIEQAYAVNEYWKEQESLFHLVGSTVVAWVISLGFLGLSWYLYWSFGGPVAVLLWVTLGQAVVISGASLLPMFEHGSLLTSSLTGTYLCYLCFNFLRHVRGTESDSWVIASTLTEMVIAVVLIGRFVSTWGLSHENEGEIAKPLVETRTEDKEEKENSQEMLVFHTLMLTTALFFATAVKTISYRGEIDSDFFLWTKVSVQGLTSLLYLWTLLAPVVLSGRDFD